MLKACEAQGGSEHELPAQDKRKHDSQPGTGLLVLIMRISRHSFV